MTMEERDAIKAHIEEADRQLGTAYDLDTQLVDESLYLRRSIAESLMAIAKLMAGRMMDND